MRNQVVELMRRLEAETSALGLEPGFVGRFGSPNSVQILERTAMLAAEHAAMVAERVAIDDLADMLAPSEAFCVMVGEDDGLEYRAGDLLPVACWHRDTEETAAELGRAFDPTWRRSPMLDKYIAAFEPFLNEWLETPPDVLSSPAVVAAEHSLAEAAGLRVIPSAALLALHTAGTPLLEALLKKIPGYRGPNE